MNMTRKNVRFYLRPDKNASEMVATKMLNELPPGWQTDFSRTAFMAGLALSEINESLPDMLVATLKDGMTADDIRRVLLSVLSSQPEKEASTSAPVASQDDSKDAPIVAAQNFSASLPD